MWKHGNVSRVDTRTTSRYAASLILVMAMPVLVVVEGNMPNCQTASDVQLGYTCSQAQLTSEATKRSLKQKAPTRGRGTKTNRKTTGRGRKRCKQRETATLSRNYGNSKVVRSQQQRKRANKCKTVSQPWRARFPRRNNR
ncbi:uncharacterized protein isoform X2 [Bombus fervidus]|uniref:uncharacterized protein isoform X2 n=1 Tax=Bombus fervidus TaxID=203811 RepID=UPI003D188F9F